MKVKLFAAAVVAAMLGTLFLNAFAASAAQPAANPSDPFDRIRIVADVSTGGTFNGTLDILYFFSDEQSGVVYARGKIDGLRIDTSGKKTRLQSEWVYVIIPYLEGTIQPLAGDLRRSAAAPAADELCSASIRLEIKLGEIKVGEDLANPEYYLIPTPTLPAAIVIGGEQDTSLCALLNIIFHTNEVIVVAGEPLMDLSAANPLANAARAARLLTILRIWFIPR